MLVSIGTFSKVTRLSIKALRLYDQLELLRPASVDSSTRYRRYHIGQARRAEMIRMLRAADMPLEAIRRLLEAEDDAAAIDQQLERHRKRLHDRLAAQERTLESLQTIIRREAARSPTRVDVTEVPGRRIASVRLRTDGSRIGADIAAAFSTLAQGIAEGALVPDGPPLCVYHDAIDEQSAGDVEVCVPVGAPLGPSPAIRERELPPARVAEALHRGSPDLIGPAFRRVMEWVFENGWQVGGPVREIYESDPSRIPEEERITRLQVPITRRSRVPMTRILILLVLGLTGLVVSLAVVGRAWLDAPDHSAYDSPRPASTGRRTSESLEHRTEAALVAAALAQPPPAKGHELLALMRTQLDARGETARIDARVAAVDAGGVPAEWVMSPGADPRRRLLYLHGGGYVAGSAKSHRPITSRMSAAARAAVLAIDYRLMPEHSRIAGIEDCRASYRWLVEQGPEGPSPAETMIVAGDSSGGSLALSLAAWARDERARRPDALVVLSPQTDLTLSSPSLVANLDSDLMQGRQFAGAVRAPKALSLWITFAMHRVKPNDPRLSPLLGDRSDLPPTLLQVSEAEVFLDDAVRYANKANAQGSEAVLQSWPFVLHVWHAFAVPEAHEAFAEIARFLEQHAPRSHR